MSQIQGRVLDSSVYGWLADVTVSLSAAGYATVIYVDGSLATRDASITALFNENDNQDVSIAGIYPYIDGSLATRDASIVALFVENGCQNFLVHQVVFCQ